MRISVYIYTPCVGSHRGQKRVLDYLELELQVVVGIKLRLSEKAVSAFVW